MLPDLWDLTCALGGEALALAGMSDAADGANRIADALHSGAAAERFGRMVAAQGGPADFLERWAEYLPVAPVQADVFADGVGEVAAIDTRTVGLAVVALGGGRRREGDRIDHSVGFVDMAAPGAAVGPDAPLARIHAADATSAEVAASALRAACRIGPGGKRSALVRERVA